MLPVDFVIERMTTLCKQRNITMNQLATMSGLSHTTVDSIIHGRSKNPQLHTLMRIAIALNMTVSEFLAIPELDNYSLEDLFDED